MNDLFLNFLQHLLKKLNSTRQHLFQQNYNATCTSNTIGEKKVKCAFFLLSQIWDVLIMIIFIYFWRHVPFHLAIGFHNKAPKVKFWGFTGKKKSKKKKASCARVCWWMMPRRRRRKEDWELFDLPVLLRVYVPSVVIITGLPWWSQSDLREEKPSHFTCGWAGRSRDELFSTIWGVFVHVCVCCVVS